MTTIETFGSLPICRLYINTTEDFASTISADGGSKISPSESMPTCRSDSGAFPVFTSSKRSPFCHLTSQGGAALASSTAFASCWTPAAVCSTALRRLRASSRANSEASFARFERVDRHQEIPAPMTVITAQIALIQLGISISISTSGLVMLTSLVAPPPYPSSFICGRFSASQSVRVKAIARELSLRDIHMSD